VIGLNALGIAAGLLPATAAIHHASDRGAPRRWRNVGFWTAFAILLMAGPWLPDMVNGCLLLMMVAFATIGLRPASVPTTSEAEREEGARRYGMRLFLPVLLLPVMAVGGTIAIADGRIGGLALIDPKQVTLVSLAAGTFFALLFAILLTRPPASAPAAEARRLSDAVGWAMVLPQMLAALGGIFAMAGVGKVVADGVLDVVPMNSPLTATIIYCVGMALFTIVLGNAFAAFPIMTLGIGLPILIRHFGGEPAIVAALGMLSGFCGTLLTPMAANFNIVPVAVLDLKDRFAVIRVQAPTGFVLLAFNIAVLALCAFPGASR